MPSLTLFAFPDEAREHAYHSTTKNRSLGYGLGYVERILQIRLQPKQLS
jgi:hypothetical protein